MNIVQESFDFRTRILIYWWNFIIKTVKPKSYENLTVDLDIERYDTTIARDIENSPH